MHTYFGKCPNKYIRTSYGQNCMSIRISTYGYFVCFLKAFRTDGRTKSCPLTPLSCHSKSFTNVKNKIEYSLTGKITTATNTFNRVENERKIKNHTCIDITLHIISGYIHIYFSSTIHIIFFTSI